MEVLMMPVATLTAVMKLGLAMKMMIHRLDRELEKSELDPSLRRKKTKKNSIPECVAKHQGNQIVALVNKTHRGRSYKAVLQSL
jgi:hypothetical protein